MPPEAKASASMIRPARVEDARAIGELFVASFRAGFSGLVGDAAMSEIAVAERRAAFHAQSIGGQASAYRTFVAREGDVLIGFVDTRPRVDPGRPDAPGDDAVGEVHALYVHPDHWGHGVGRALLSAALSELTSRGFTAATLWSLAANARARGFYEAAGMSTDGETRRVEAGDEALPHVQYRIALPSPTP